MRKSLPGTFATITGAVLLLSAAASPSRAADDAAWASPLSAMMAPGALMPKTPAGPTASKPASQAAHTQMLLMKGIQLVGGGKKASFGIEAVPQLQYYGGPMLSNVKIQVVYWNDAVANQDKLPGFFAAITQSPYFDWLKEYNTPSATLGRGALLGAYTDSVQNPSGQIEDADIRTELTSLLSKNAVPQADANTLYMVYFPPGLNIDFGGSGSCQVFCAYHNTFMNNGTEINYGVIPDQGGSCAGGCGGDPDTFNNETSVSSHEMIESVTDPAVGLVTGNEPVAPLGWYDAANGEIGDICNGVQGKVGAYTVQREWSNSRGLCVTSAQDSGTPASPSVASKTGDSGSIGSQP